MLSDSDNAWVIYHSGSNAVMPPDRVLLSLCCVLDIPAEHAQSVCTSMYAEDMLHASLLCPMHQIILIVIVFSHLQYKYTLSCCICRLRTWEGSKG